MIFHTLIFYTTVFSNCVFGAPQHPEGPTDTESELPGPYEPRVQHHEPPPPPFLQNVTSDGRKAYFVIVKNEDLTIEEVDSQLATWAKSNGVLEEYNSFQANETARSNAIQENVAGVIASLSVVKAQRDAIFSNRSITRKAQKKAIDALGESHPIEMENLFFLSEAAAEELDDHEGPRGPRRRQHGAEGFGESEGH